MTDSAGARAPIKLRCDDPDSVPAGSGVQAWGSVDQQRAYQSSSDSAGAAPVGARAPIEPLIEKLETAHRELCEAVRRQWDGKHAFKLSIPARPDHDTDLIIGAAIRDALAALRSGPAQKDAPEPETELCLRAACMDCGLPYEKFPLDMLLPRPQWLAIHPEENGLLCAQCMVARASQVPGATVVHAVIEVAPWPRRERCSRKTDEAE